MEESLKKKTLHGVIWSSVQKFGTLGLSFIANIILARLLTPSDFGCIGMLTIFIAVSQTFVDGGFGSALIQKKEPTNKDYSTILYLNIVISALLYIILYLTSGFIAEFYHLPLLEPVLKLLGLVLILNATSIIQINRMRKLLQFQKLSVIYIVSISVSVVVAIYMAYSGWGVWSLVWMQLIYSVCCSVLVWIFGGWTPSLCFSTASLKQLFGFGSFLLLSNLINNFCNNIQGLLIGRMFTPAVMGYYSQAKKLEDVPSSSISSIIDNVSYPVMAAKQDSPDELIAAVKKFISILAFLTFPIMGLLIVLAKPLIVTLYSDKWVECVPYFQILCIAGIAICLQTINYNAVAARGKSKSLFRWTVIKRGVGLILIGIGCFFGIYGILIGYVCVSWFVYFCNAYLVDKFLHYQLITQAQDLMPILGCTILAIACAYTPILFCSPSVPIYSLQTTIFCGIYLVSSQMIKSIALSDIKALVMRKI